MPRDRNHRVKNHRRKELMLDGVPSDLRTALVSCAREQAVSVNELAVRILAEHYKVKVTTPENGLRGHAGPATNVERNADTTKLSVRGSAKLHRAISIDAARRGGTIRGVVLERLNLHFSLPTEPIGRRPRTKETTA